MGSGGSKPEPGQDARLRPILRRRLEEFVTRRHGGISKKQLLAGDATVSRPDSEGEEEEEKDQHHQQLTPKKQYTTPPSSPPRTSNDDRPFHDTQQCPPTPQINDNITVDASNLSPKKEDNIDENVIDNDDDDDEDDNSNNNHNNASLVNEKNGVNDDDSKNVDEINSECKKEDDCDDDVNVKKLQDMEISSKESSEEEAEEGNFEELERVDFFPGSPSFRVYCIQSLDDELDENVGHDLDSEESNKDDEKDCACEESTSSNKVVVAEKEVIKKHKRGIRKLKLITIPKVARKSIMHNMQSLYNFPCSCNSHNSHQLMQQAAA